GGLAAWSLEVGSALVLGAWSLEVVPEGSHRTAVYLAVRALSRRQLSCVQIGLVSLGCPKTLVDSEVMLGLAQGAGHELTQDPSAADVLVVKICAFIDDA